MPQLSRYLDCHFEGPLTIHSTNDRWRTGTNRFDKSIYLIFQRIALFEALLLYPNVRKPRDKAHPLLLFVLAHAIELDPCDKSYRWVGRFDICSARLRSAVSRCGRSLVPNRRSRRRYPRTLAFPAPMGPGLSPSRRSATASANGASPRSKFRCLHSSG